MNSIKKFFTKIKNYWKKGKKQKAVIIVVVLFLIGIGGTSGSKNDDSTTNNDETTVTANDSSKSTIKEKKEEIEIPDFNTIPVVQDWCNENGMQMSTSEEYSDSVESGKIISQVPSAGSKVEKGKDKIVITYSKGKKPSMEEQNALSKAERYSSIMYMSKSAIYKQLTSEYGEGFTAEAAQYAIDHLEADYNKNALEKAKSYQEKMQMSKSAIYEQLTSEYGEGFTAEEAQYAIDNLPQ